MDVIVAVVTALLVNLAIILRVRHSLPGEEGLFLSRVYGQTIALRYLIAIFLYLNLDEAGFAGLSPFAVTFWGDSSTYDIGGHLLSLSWGGDVLVNPYLSRSHESGVGFIYFVAAVYYFFGRNQLLIQFLNGIIGGLAVLAVYGIAARLFDRESARWAARFMAFFPQMIFWSSAMYKDPAVILCIAISMYAAIRLKEHFSTRHLILFISACLALLTLRFYIFYMVAFATLSTFVFGQKRRAAGSVFAQIGLIGAFLVAFSFAAEKETVERQTQYFNLQNVQVVRSEQAQLGKSSIRGAADVSGTASAVAYLPIGLAYLLFAPFPWAISGMRQLLALPDTLAWYVLMPAFWRGMRYTFRNRLKESLPILLFAGILTVAYALFQGNVGTAYRQRTQITMFFFIFMGVGLVEKQRQRMKRLPSVAGQPASAP